MFDLVFSHIRKVFSGDVTAVEDFSLTIPGPSLIVLVGPSGCGKTTLLRMVAGLEAPTSGEIHLGATRLDTLTPRQRDVAMVFQSYALYPHMTVRENLSFGLRLRKTPRAEVEAAVREVAVTLEMDGLLARRPGELSGGQRQRVALGRAIIRKPRVFLFDEPLSNLDARLRAEMRATIKTLYNRLKVTSIYVTHDQVEAMTLGEVLVVMNEGRIHQTGPPEVCYRKPRDVFVASFLGSPPMNLLAGRLDGDSGEFDLGDGRSLRLSGDLSARLSGHEEDLVMGIRPESFDPASLEDGEGMWLRGKITLREPMGHETLTHVQVGGATVVARGTADFPGDGDGTTTVYIRGDDVHFFAHASGERIGTRPDDG